LKSRLFCGSMRNALALKNRQVVPEAAGVIVAAAGRDGRCQDSPRGSHQWRASHRLSPVAAVGRDRGGVWRDGEAASPWRRQAWRFAAAPPAEPYSLRRRRRGHPGDRATCQEPASDGLSSFTTAVLLHTGTGYVPRLVRPRPVSGQASSTRFGNRPGDQPPDRSRNGPDTNPCRRAANAGFIPCFT